MKTPMWMYFLAIDADGVATVHMSKDEAIEYARASGRAEYHVYRVDSWTRMWALRPDTEWQCVKCAHVNERIDPNCADCDEPYETTRKADSDL